MGEEDLQEEALQASSQPMGQQLVGQRADARWVPEE
jgi:hypothetical protein